MLYAPVDQRAFYRRLFEHAIEVPGPHVEQLGGIARRHRAILSVGVTEKGSVSMGAMWNTNLIFDADGRLLNRHRKLVPTWAEKLTWANGDASNLRVETTAVARSPAVYFSLPQTENALSVELSFHLRSSVNALRITYGNIQETFCMASWRFARTRKAIVTAPRSLRLLQKQAE
jgi:hypothetical protein